MSRLLLLAVAAFAVPSVSLAQARLQVGARLGYSVSRGNAFESEGERVPMKEASLGAQVPLQLDVGAKLSPELAVGGYVSYGFGKVDGEYLGGVCGLETTAGTMKCTGNAWRLGAQGTYTFAGASSSLVPWIGLNLGYESTTAEAKNSAVSVRVSLTGWEAGLQLGGDYRVSESFAFGPYVGVHLGRFGDAELSLKAPGQSQSGSESIDEKAWHQWFGFGVRGLFTL